MKIRDIIEGKSENRELWDRIKSKGVVPSIDRERYTDMSGEGLEGPFRMKNGQVLYYDPKEGKYYNRDTDMYVDYDDYRAMNENDNDDVGAQIADLIRKKNSASSPIARKNIDAQIVHLKKQRNKTNEEDAYDKDVKSSNKPHDKEAAAKRAKAAALAASKKAKEQGVAEGWKDIVGGAVGGGIGGAFVASPAEMIPGIPWGVPALAGTALGAALGAWRAKALDKPVYQVYVNGKKASDIISGNDAVRLIGKLASKEHDTKTTFAIMNVKSDRIVFRQVWSTNSDDTGGDPGWVGNWSGKESKEQGVAEADKRPEYVVKASDKPKVVKPNTGGSSKHPYQGKLVGEAEVGNTEYQWAHGKKPSGHGSWFFVAHRGGIDFGKDVEDQDYIQLHGMSFGDAKKAAIKWAKSKGHPSLFVAT